MSSPTSNRVTDLADGHAETRGRPLPSEEDLISPKELPLRLNVQELSFTLYELRPRRFAVTEKAQAELEPLVEHSPGRRHMLSGNLASNDGQFSVPVNFRLSHTRDGLLFCELRRLDPNVEHAILQQIDRLENGSREVQPTNSTIAPTTAPTTVPARVAESEQESTTVRDVYLESSIGQRIAGLPARTRSKSVSSKPFRFSSKSRIAVGSLAALVGLAGVLHLIPAGNKRRSEQSLTSSEIVPTDFSTVEVSALEDSGVSLAPKPEGDQTDHLPRISFNGRLEQQVDVLHSLNTGRIINLLVSPGKAIQAGDSILILSEQAASPDRKRLEADLSLAKTELEAATSKLKDAEDRIERGKQKLIADVEVLREDLQRLEGRRQLASLQWQKIEPLVQRQNIGRREWERVQQELADSTTSYSTLKEIVSKREQILQSDEIEELIAGKLGLSIVSLQADINVARARCENLEEHLRIEDQQNATRSVTAAFDATIGKLFVNEGDTVEAGQPVCELVSGGSRVVQIQLPIAQASKYKIGQPVVLRLPDSNQAIMATVQRITGRMEEENQQKPSGASTSSRDIGQADQMDAVAILRLVLEPNYSTLPLGTMLILETTKP